MPCNANLEGMALTRTVQWLWRKGCDDFIGQTAEPVLNSLFINRLYSLVMNHFTVSYYVEVN